LLFGRRKEDKQKVTEYFTIMILPGPNSRVRKFSISKPFIKRVAIAAAAIAVVSVAMLGEYYHMHGQVTELDHLRVETVRHRGELKVFAGKIVDMKTQMAKIKEYDSKLRKLSNIESCEPKEQVLGIGGSQDITTITLDDLGSKSHDELFKQMRMELDELKGSATDEAVSMSRLTEFFDERNSIMASTPSIWPVRGFITSNFGYRKSPVTGDRRFHEGLDIANRSGTQVVAPADGTVIYAGYQGGYGRTVKVQHGYGYVTLYGHLSKYAVNKGQRVKKGDVIGYVGNSGRSTGPHLHYEVRVNGVPTNPKKYM
jgi:biotin carboxyl carrier protein